MWQVIDFLLAHKFIFNSLIISLILIIRRITLSQIRGDVAFLSEDQRNWMSRTKNSTFAIIVITLFSSLKSEISEFALSVTAIAVAIVVASKEIICVSPSSIQRAGSLIWGGDWIEVGKIGGEVIEHNDGDCDSRNRLVSWAMPLHWQETATLPNSMFFLICKGTSTSWSVTFTIALRWRWRASWTCTQWCRVLLSKLKALWRVYRCCIVIIAAALSKNAGVDLHGSEPHIHITSSSTGDKKSHFMIFCPTEKAVHLEQEIRKDFMEAYAEAFPISA